MATKAKSGTALFKSFVWGKRIRQVRPAIVKGIGFNLTGRKFFVSEKTKSSGKVFSLFKTRSKRDAFASKLSNKGVKGIGTGRLGI